LRQAVDKGYSIPQSWGLLNETMSTPMPVKAAAPAAKPISR
jgi:hypothetical protein